MDALLEEGGTKAVSKRQYRLFLWRKWRLLHCSQQALLLVMVFGALTLIVLLMGSRDVVVTRVPEIRFPDIVSTEYSRSAVPARQYFKGPQNERQKAVVNSFLHAWRGYQALAWGKDELDPVNNRSLEWFGLSLTLIDALDTAIIMGLDDEYEEARREIAANFTVDVNKFVSLFEVTIRVLGGLITVYQLTGDALFLEKARKLGDRLLPAFKTPSGIPHNDVNLHSGVAQTPSWTKYASLAEVATLQLEFRELTYLTGDTKYEEAAFKVSRILHEFRCNKYSGLCPMNIDVSAGSINYSGSVITMGARSDTYYEYLLKQWLQTGKKIAWLKEDFSKAMRGMLKYLGRRSEPSKLFYIGEILPDGMFSPKMDHLACFIAGTLALAVQNGFDADLLIYAKDLAKTCRAMYTSNPTGLGPEIVHFNGNPLKAQDIIIHLNDEHSLLRPEAVEAWFYLYRLTNDSMYQDWGWDLLQAIERHAKTDAGYCSVQSVMKVPTTCKPKMESFLLAETFKYLYLLFDSSATLFPFNQYVFNTEAHPFRLRV